MRGKFILIVLLVFLNSPSNSKIAHAFEKLESLKAILNELRQFQESVSEPSLEAPGYISFNVNPFQYGEYGKTDPLERKPHLSKSPRATGYRAVYNKQTKRYFEHVSESTLPAVISNTEIRKFPYYNVVKLSSGCTGTLITNEHVLTSAHCVHDGEGFKNNMEMLKVKVPNKIGFRIHYILKINVPIRWLKMRFLPDIARAAFDYAVLQLDLPVGGRDTFMQLTLPTTKILHSDLNFLSFNTANSYWLQESTCLARDNLLLFSGSVALRTCESTIGNSGAAVFTESVLSRNKIVGLLSNTLSPTTGSFLGENKSLNTITLLTMDKCVDICAMIHPLGEKYEVCELVKNSNQEYLQVATRRLMPFFG
ncbi:serine protease 23-like [Dreissena polymorpha]|uniref:Peptidase S1 domain-containing protein n=1 Tax=Dreissena polymorpha TaxID=45954 RepID=A0A9D4GLG4_DREPO|nr:serine protease 23-like [Dreissena polymorpha]KAH3819038.1 hypothetical protein DPMN_120768 [Dreissena polymorpha]